MWRATCEGFQNDMQRRIQNRSILQTCPPSRTAEQQSGGSAAAVVMTLPKNAQQQEVVAMIPIARRFCPRSHAESVTEWDICDDGEEASDQKKIEHWFKTKKNWIYLNFVSDNIFGCYDNIRHVSAQKLSGWKTGFTFFILLLLNGKLGPIF